MRERILGFCHADGQGSDVRSGDDFLELCGGDFGVADAVSTVNFFGDLFNSRFDRFVERIEELEGIGMKMGSVP